LLHSDSILTGRIDAYLCRCNGLMSKRQTFLTKHNRLFRRFRAVWPDYCQRSIFEGYTESIFLLEVSPIVCLRLDFPFPSLPGSNREIM
jgi:hypothetical protein